MDKIFVKNLCFALLFLTICTMVCDIHDNQVELHREVDELKTKIDSLEERLAETEKALEEATKKELEIVEEPPVEPEEPKATRYEINLIALVTMAEAEGEPEEGQRLVVDTILNRVDSPNFPNSIHDVIYQKNQFSCMWDGRIDKCEVQEKFVKMVEEELEERINNECVFFRTKNFSQYGAPLFRVGNHYFSKENDHA